MKPNAPRYTYPAPVWGPDKCARMAKRTAKDGLGTPYSFKGAVPELPTSTDYNGGTIVNGKWYQGVIYSLPILAPGFKWVRVPTWCYRIVKET